MYTSANTQYDLELQQSKQEDMIGDGDDVDAADDED
jgi:hypothetical protein